MSEFDARKLRRRAEEHTDDRDESSAAAEPYEQTYRDGSLKNECWRSDDDP